MLIHAALLLLPLVAQDAGDLQAGDPEAGASGRDVYLGREVARTMHWMGAKWLLRKTREDQENGVLLREWLDVQPGDAVCDLGCGNGYHTLPLAEAVGPGGKVFAVDLQPEMLEFLAERAREVEVDNLVFVEATVDDPKLPAASCDLVLMVDVYHEISHPVRVMEHVRRALKPGGRVVLVEFRAEDRAIPIKPLHKMTKAQVVREMAAGGFVLVGETDDLPWQHVMAFSVAQGDDPRLEARALTRGFLDAMGGVDARVVEPYLAERVVLDDGASMERRPFAVVLGEWMRENGAAIPPGTRAELSAGLDGHTLATLEPPAGESLFNERDTLSLSVDESGRWQVDGWHDVVFGKMPARPHGARRPFIAMNTGTGPGTPTAQAALTCELGFDGIGWGTDHVAEVRAACESAGGDLWSVYHVLDVADPGGSGIEQLRRTMDALSGGPGMVWLALRNGDVVGRAHSGDRVAIDVLRELSEHAETTGVEIALYPHTGYWLEQIEDALRIADAIDDPRLGVCFNLCHYLRSHRAWSELSSTDGDALLVPLLTLIPRLFAVTLNGADMSGETWSELIQPLGHGDHELGTLLNILDVLGFEGPVGLQGYGLKAPAREHLSASMAVWRAAYDR